MDEIHLVCTNSVGPPNLTGPVPSVGATLASAVRVEASAGVAASTMHAFWNRIRRGPLRLSEPVAANPSGEWASVVHWVAVYAEMLGSKQGGDRRNASVLEARVGHAESGPACVFDGQAWRARGGRLAEDDRLRLWPSYLPSLPRLHLSVGFWVHFLGSVFVGA